MSPITTGQMFTLFLDLTLLLISFVSKTNGGTCWLAIGGNGRCRSYERTEVTFEECCSNTHTNNGWTAKDNPDSGQLFFWHALAGGAPKCQPCHVNCETLECARGHRCRMRNGQPKCVCDPNCSQLRMRHEGPICGTDRRTYRNRCSLLKHNCRQNDNVQVNFHGQCQSSCESVVCDEGRYCVHDQHGLPHCIRCHLSCPPVTGQHQAVCGTNGVTYDSVCHFQVETCRGGARGVSIAYDGPCDATLSCEEVACHHNKKCLHDPSSGSPRCVTCGGYCHDPDDSPPICGTDGSTYLSYCHMKRLSCIHGVYVDTAHSGPCL